MKKFIVALILLVPLIGGLWPRTTFALDYFTFNNHVLNGGVGDYGYSKRYFYAAPSTFIYGVPIKNAMNEWIYTTERTGITTPISFRQTTTQADSIMDIHAGNYTIYPYNQMKAWTEHWRYSNRIDPYLSNWGWGKIVINNTNTLEKSQWAQEGVIAHEMGHVLGLAENNTISNSIMTQEAYGRNVNKAQACDLKGINHLY